MISEPEYGPGGSLLRFSKMGGGTENPVIITGCTSPTTYEDKNVFRAATVELAVMELSSSTWTVDCEHANSLSIIFAGISIIF